MLTNNWQAIMVYMMNALWEEVMYTKSTDGTGASQGYFPINFNDGYTTKFIIGQGNTAAKKTDYNLENEIDSSKYECAIQKLYTKTYDSENSYVKLIGNITNKSDDALSVSEIGLTISYNSKTFLYDREVFKDPIVIAPGASKAFEIKLA